MGNLQGGHSALLLQLWPLLQPLSRARPSSGRECISLLTANTCKQGRNKPKNSAGVCKLSKASSHEPPANTLDCYSDSLHTRAWLWCRPVVCKPGFYHHHLLQPQHPGEGERFAASCVSSSLFIINHSSLSPSSCWHQTKPTQLLHWSDWEQERSADKDLNDKFPSFKPGLYNMLGKGRMAQFSPPVISQEPKILEAQLQLPAARAASSAATKPFPWLPSEFTVVVWGTGQTDQTQQLNLVNTLLSPLNKLLGTWKNKALLIWDKKHLHVALARTPAYSSKRENTFSPGANPSKGTCFPANFYTSRNPVPTQLIIQQPR